MGPLKYFLGIEFDRSSDRILMTQQKYILDLLQETKHTQYRISDTPIEVNHRLTLDDKDPKIEITSYQKLIRKLLYVSHTRLNICFTVNVVSQFMHSPRNAHFQVANRVLRYLKGMSGLGITYRKIGKIDLTQILHAPELTIGPQRDIVPFLDETWSPGEVKNIA